MIDIGRLDTASGGVSGWTEIHAGRTRPNVPEPMAGYAQLSRAAEPLDRLWQSLVAGAARYGGYLDRFVYDPEPLTQPSFKLPTRTPLPRWIVEVATETTGDPAGLSATTPNSGFWKLVADLLDTGGVIVTTSIDQLAFLGTAREAVLQWLSHGHPPVTVLFAAIGEEPRHASWRVTDSTKPPRSAPPSDSSAR